MTEVQAKIDAAFRMRRAICLISEKRPSQERAVIDQFLMHIAPSMAPAYGGNFPRTCRRHPLDQDRMKEGLGKAPTLYFHIGNAILGFYDYLNLLTKAATKPHDLERALETIERRVFILESVARYGLDYFYVDGSDSTGYALAPLPPLKIEGFNELPVAAQV